MAKHRYYLYYQSLNNKKITTKVKSKTTSTSSNTPVSQKEILLAIYKLNSQRYKKPNKVKNKNNF